MSCASCGGKARTRERLFWESKASSYPLAFDKETFSRTARIIDFVVSHGIPVKGTDVLDIGCGTGAFSLPLAERGASMTALDISGAMLERLMGESRRMNLQRVRTVRDSWQEIDVGKAGLERAFDVVLSAFSDAVGTEEDIAKMERCSKDWCLSVASGRIDRSSLCREIFRALGAPLNPKPDIRDLKRRLEGMGRVFLFKSFAFRVKERRSLGEITGRLANRLEAAGKDPDPDSVFTTVASLAGPHLDGDETIECRGTVHVGLLLWRIDGKEP